MQVIYTVNSFHLHAVKQNMKEAQSLWTGQPVTKDLR